MDAAEKAKAFAALHRRGEPLILYNAWDAGSARAVAAAGAEAIATGSYSVAAAFGCEDGEALPFELVLANAERIAAAVDLPVTIDFEGGYAADPAGFAANVSRLAATGAIGCNVEDRVVGGEGLHAIAQQAERLRAARVAAGDCFFLNARTDIFLAAPPASHDKAMAEAAIERGLAYAEAGASGLFVPGIRELDWLAQICSASPLPVNFLTFAGGPSNAELAAAGVSRISHGGAPYRLAMKALSAAAETAMRR